MAIISFIANNTIRGIVPADFYKNVTEIPGLQTPSGSYLPARNKIYHDIYRDKDSNFLWGNGAITAFDIQTIDYSENNNLNENSDLSEKQKELSEKSYDNFLKSLELPTVPLEHIRLLIDEIKQKDPELKESFENFQEDIYQKVINLAKKYTVKLSFFEIQMVAMILYFTEEKVDYAVIETGL